MTIEEIKSDLKKRLTESRYMHSLSVADKACELAKLYGADTDRAYLAGLVHDCAKCLTKDELLFNINRYKIALDDIQKASPQLWHSYIGAYMARDCYGIEDKEILDAVYYHTTGKAGMSVLCAIIYLADAIEESRSYESVDAIRKLAESSLWDATYEYTKASVSFVKAKGSLVHHDTLELLDELNRRKK